MFFSLTTPNGYQTTTELGDSNNKFVIYPSMLARYETSATMATSDAGLCGEKNIICKKKITKTYIRIYMFF